MKNGKLSYSIEEINKEYVAMESSTFNPGDNEKAPFFATPEVLLKLRDMAYSMEPCLIQRDFINLMTLMVNSNKTHLTRSSDPFEKAVSDMIIKAARIRMDYSPSSIEDLYERIYLEDNVRIPVEYEAYLPRPISESEIKYLGQLIADEAATIESHSVINSLKVVLSNYGSARNCTTVKRDAYMDIINHCQRLSDISSKAKIQREAEPVFFLNNRDKRRQSVESTARTVLAPGAVLRTPSMEMNAMLSGCDLTNPDCINSGVSIGTSTLIGAPTGGGKSLTMLQLAEWFRIANDDIGRRIINETGKIPIIAYITQENTVTETLGRFGKMFFPKTATGASFSISKYLKFKRSQNVSPSEALMEAFDDHCNRFPSAFELVVIPKTAGTITTDYFYELYDELDKQGYKLMVVIHDYMKTLRSKDPSLKEPRFIYEAISQEVKTFAKTKKVAFISAFQLNRKYAARKSELTRTKAKGVVVNDGENEFVPDNTKNLVRHMSIDDIAECAAMAHEADVVIMMQQERDEWTDCNGVLHRDKYLGIKNVKCRDGQTDRVAYFRYRCDEMSLYTDYENGEHVVGKGRFATIGEYRPDNCIDFLAFDSTSGLKVNGFPIPKTNPNNIIPDDASIPNVKPVVDGGISSFDKVLEEANRESAACAVAQPKKTSIFSKPAEPKPEPVKEEPKIEEKPKVKLICPFTKARKEIEERTQERFLDLTPEKGTEEEAVAANIQSFNPMPSTYQPYYNQPVYSYPQQFNAPYFGYYPQPYQYTPQYYMQ